MERDPLERLLAGLSDEVSGAEAGDPWAGQVEAATLTHDQEAWLARFDDQPSLPRIRGDFLGE